MSNKITYKHAEDFYYGIFNLITKGLVFEADFATLTITLTGGY